MGIKSGYCNDKEHYCACKYLYLRTSASDDSIPEISMHCDTGGFGIIPNCNYFQDYDSVDTDEGDSDLDFDCCPVCGMGMLSCDQAGCGGIVPGSIDPKPSVDRMNFYIPEVKYDKD